MQLRQPLAELAVVLLRQHLGGSHQGTLTAGINGGEQGGDGNNGLTAAHIPLHQPGHGLIADQVSVDLRQHPSLGCCEPERQQGEEGADAAAAGATVQRWSGAAGELASALQQAQLQQQKLIEHQPATGERQGVPIAGAMDLPEGFPQGRQSLPLQECWRQRIAPATGCLQQGPDQAAQPIGGKALREAVHRQQATDLLALDRGAGTAQHLHQRVLEHGAVGGLFDQPTHRHRGTSGVLPLLGLQPAGGAEAPAGEKLRHPQPAGEIGELQLKNREVRIARAREAVAAANRGHDRGRGAGLQSSDAHQIGVVEIIARVVADKVLRQPQIQCREARSGLGPDAAHLPQGGIWTDDLRRRLGAASTRRCCGIG